jgi:hypothetical protein
MAKRKKPKKQSTPPNFNQPGFKASSISRETAKKMVSHKLSVQGITGADLGNAMNRGKLTQNSAGKYTFSTNAQSPASPSGRDVPLPPSK